MVDASGNGTRHSILDSEKAGRSPTNFRGLIGRSRRYVFHEADHKGRHANHATMSAALPPLLVGAFIPGWVMSGSTTPDYRHGRRRLATHDFVETNCKSWMAGLRPP